ncbi:hypothetical protein [Sphaerimonospora thailandensis]|uniref:Pentapeptide repeat protein n=1 Tax=Sphaerimonospora thailandensis TaxID=795644 RepID=A0A8J3R5W5_9ACTN|nr:hypothetical protein [Sphaerimonospora thailandensis]GIH67917.1 hypothetical protein Mth01_01700 [Sphaerimonospora thailandensis]
MTKAERRLWEAYPTGAWVDFREGRDHAPASGGPQDRTRSVRAKVIAALLLDVRENEPGQVPGIRLAGARIIGDLNLSDAAIDAKIHLFECHVEGITLNDARTRGVRLRSCDIHRFRAGRATIDGLLDLDGSTIRGRACAWRTPTSRDSSGSPEHGSARPRRFRSGTGGEGEPPDGATNFPSGMSRRVGGSHGRGRRPGCGPAGSPWTAARSCAGCTAPAGCG